MAKMIFINLPVKDVDRSSRFYEAIGGSRNAAFSNEQATAIVMADNIWLMLLSHDFYRGFTSLPIADPRRTSSMLLAWSCDSRSEVDAMVAKAAAAGGTADPGPTQEHGFMYGRSFLDPDGHHWEPHWMDPAAAAGEAPPETIKEEA